MSGAKLQNCVSLQRMPPRVPQRPFGSGGVLESPDSAEASVVGALASTAAPPSTAPGLPCPASPAGVVGCVGVPGVVGAGVPLPGTVGCPGPPLGVSDPALLASASAAGALDAGFDGSPTVSLRPPPSFVPSPSSAQPVTRSAAANKAAISL
jgi:hypothetical protein